MFSDALIVGLLASCALASQQDHALSFHPASQKFINIEASA